MWLEALQPHPRLLNGRSVQKGGVLVLYMLRKNFSNYFHYRIQRALEATITLAKSFPTDNSPSTDLLGSIERLRAKFKTATSLLRVSDQRYHTEPTAAVPSSGGKTVESAGEESLATGIMALKDDGGGTIGTGPPAPPPAFSLW